MLARYGRSFRLAGRLLPGAILASAAELYAFCRTVDDLADEAADPAEARAALGVVRHAILAGDRDQPEAARFLALRDRTGASLQAAIALIDTVLSDLEPVRVPDEAALLRYAHGVAGTVGLMMCAVLDARDPGAEAHAVDLGIAMQLTNIARDVIEDAARGRVYLPATWLPPGIVAANVPAMAGAVFPGVERVLARADQFYRRAELGYRFLPARVRPAIQASARLYEEIGLRIARRGARYLHEGRCVVPTPRKLFLLAGCLAKGRLATPHAALDGQPGAPA